MAHTLQIGNTSSDPRVLHKTFNLDITVSVNLKEGCSVLQPHFILDYNSSYAACNYCYFSDWGRYYYINNIQMLPGNKCQLDCIVDPMQSFNTEIENLRVMVERQEKKRNSMLVDEDYPIESSYLLEQIAFPESFGGYGSGNNAVIEIVGGAS